MPSDFRSYEEQQHRRQLLTAATAVGLVGAVAGVLRAPSIRTKVSGLLLRGAESLGARLGGRVGNVVPPSRAFNVASELNQLIERGIPQAARASIGHRLGTKALEVELGQSQFTSRIAETAAFRNFLLAGKANVNEFLRHREIQALLTEQANRDQLRKSLEAGLTAARAAVPSIEEVRQFGAVIEAQQRIGALSANQIKSMSATTFGRTKTGRITDFLGITPLTVGQLRTQTDDLGIHAQEIFAKLEGLVDARDIDAIAMQGIYRTAQGQLVDLRSLQYQGQKAFNWLSDNFQVPLAPGMMGISPFKLFPWLQGRLGRTFAHVSEVARDPLLAAQLQSGGRAVGKDVFKVGDRFLAADFPEAHLAGNAEGLVQDLGVRGDLRSGLFGFLKRRAEFVNASLEAREAGRPQGFRAWLGLGKQLEVASTGFDPVDQQSQSLKARFLSVFQKYNPESNWAPNLFRRLFNDDLETVSPTDIRRAGAFLGSVPLSTGAQDEILGAAARTFKGDPLGDLAANFTKDQSLLDFLHAQASLENPTLFSSHMRELVNQYRTSPSDLMNRLQVVADKSVLGWNLFGIRGEQRGLSVAREAVLGEIEARIAGEQGSEAFTNFARSVGSRSVADELLAYGYGRILQNVAGQSDEEIMGALRWLRNQVDSRESLRRIISQNAKPWHTFMEDDDLPLRTAELFVKKEYGFLEQFNQARKAGASFSEAMGQTVFGPWGGQYSAFFTGNQENVTTATLGLEAIPRKLNDYFAEVGLGLPSRDLLSGGSILSNLMLKRVLPAVLAVELYRYSDYKADQLGLDGPSDIYANVRGLAGRIRARFTGENLFGLGKRELFPGLEKWLPTRSVEEEQQHQESGYEAMRKGRFWSLGSRTQFLGDKIDYYLPSAVQVARSDWQGAENVDLNTRDYWRNSLIPLPENFFLGPLNPLRNPYWWENKHSRGPNADRPYLQSGPMFDPTAIHGPLANSLVGNFLKPPQTYYPQYIPQSMGGSASREDLRAINEAMKQGADRRDLGIILGGGGGTGLGGGGGGYGGGGGTGLNIGIPGVLGTGGSLPSLPGSFATATSAGNLQLLSVPADMTPSEFGSVGRSTRREKGHGVYLSRREIEKINRLTEAGVGGLNKLRGSSIANLINQVDPISEEQADLIDYENPYQSAARISANVAGLYGFMAEQVIGTNQTGPIIETASRAYGFQRRFYELGLGGLGGSLSEVGRRFMPRQSALTEWYNPVPNMMPGWMPGPEYFKDFRHGDPYSKIARGEIRLPGEAYERVHPNIRLMQARASSLGHSVEELMQEMLFLKEPLSQYGEDVTELGTALHETIQRSWKKRGILLGAEQRIYNRELGISGHFDAILATQEGPVVGEIKSVSDKRFQEAMKAPFSEHVQQINFYLHETGLPKGTLFYVNRDAPWQVLSHDVGYNPGLFAASVGKVQEARRRLNQMVDRGTISRGELYDPVTRFEILADVAPYSDNYYGLREYLTEENKSGQLSPEDNTRFQAAKKRVAQQKRKTETTPYRFLGNNLKHRTYTVGEILDANTFTVRESDSPIRMAGVRSSNKRIEEVLGEIPEGMTAAEYMFAQYGIHPGARVRVAVEGDDNSEVADDVLKTTHAVVYGRGGNVNKQLINRGIGIEKETDFSDTGVEARFSAWEQWKGAMWERFAHLDTPFHTKFLRVRSPLEELERGIVYGKNTGGWENPVRDYVLPTIQSYASKSPLIAAAGMGVFASYFFRQRKSKLAAASLGAVFGGGLSTLRSMHETLAMEAWKPGRTQKREDLEEYWDILKYIKYRGLAASEARLAQKKEGVDVEAMIREIHAKGERRKRKKWSLEEKKRELKRRNDEDDQGEIATIQNELDSLSEARQMMKLGPHATLALQYTEQYRSTLYGVEPGKTPFLHILQAMPKYKRELVNQFIEKSTPEEKKKIFRLLPRAEQRVLGRYLGVDESRIPDRPLLRNFFRDHQLPDAKWAGWRPDVDIEALRLRAIKGEGLDPFESGVYPLQIDEAEERTQNVPVPTMSGNSMDIQKRLNTLLSGRGLKNVSVVVDITPHSGDRDDVRINMRLRQRREQDIMSALQLGE